MAAHDEGIEHLQALRDARRPHRRCGGPARRSRRRSRTGIRTLVGAEVLRAEGKERVRFAVLRDAEGVTRGIGCDLFVAVGGPLAEGRPRPDGRVRDAVEVVGDASIGDAGGCRGSPRAPCACARTCPSRTWSARGRRGTARRSSPSATRPRRWAPARERCAGGTWRRSRRRESTTTRRTPPARTTARPPARPVAAGHPRRRRPSRDREAHLPARRARRGGRTDGVVGLLAAAVRLRRRVGRVPGRPRARVRDGRGHAREVPRHGAGRDRA